MSANLIDAHKPKNFRKAGIFVVIGEKIRQLRIKTNLTQEELANRCDLSKGFISQLERDLTSPSIATLIDILECLGTDLKGFFNENESSKTVFEPDDIFTQENSELGHTINWLVPNAQKNEMEPILLKIAKSGKSSIYPAHDGEVFGYVIAGTVTLHIGDKRYAAKKGESFYYKANASHYIENNSKSEATILWVSTPPSF